MYSQPRASISRALARPGVDRAQAVLGHNPADGRPRILGVRRDEDVEHLPAHLTSARLAAKLVAERADRRVRQKPGSAWERSRGAALFALLDRG
jgi:hypothetical protein